MKKKKTAEESRGNHRLSIDIPVKIRYNGVTVPGKTVNLSCGGVFIRTPRAETLEDDCDITLRLPDGKEPLVLQSEVVWKQNPEESPAPAQVQNESEEGAGLKFKSLTPDQKERINLFIERQLKQNLH